MTKDENKSEDKKTVIIKKRKYFVPSVRKSVEADSPKGVVEVLKTAKSTNKKGSK